MQEPLQGKTARVEAYLQHVKSTGDRTLQLGGHGWRIVKDVSFESVYGRPCWILQYHSSPFHLSNVYCSMGKGPYCRLLCPNSIINFSGLIMLFKALSYSYSSPRSSSPTLSLQLILPHSKTKTRDLRSNGASDVMLHSHVYRESHEAET